MNGGRIHSVMNGIRLILVCVSLLLSIMTARGGIYAGPQVFADGQLEYSAFDGGYFNADGSPCYYITDWQGNNAAVVNSAGSIIQSAAYYPYGEPIVEPKGQRFLFGGKEREHAGGRNAYDFGARSLTPYGSWPSPDPKAEDFYQVSPFSYCAGDPINRIDENGEFWDTLWDIGNLVFDIYKAVESHIDGEHEKAKEYWGHAAFDLGTALVPFVPAGASKLSKVGKYADEVLHTGKGLKNAGRIKEGKKLEHSEILKAKDRGEDVVSQATVVPINGVGNIKGNRSRVDMLTKNSDGTYTITEIKLTSKTPLSKGQHAVRNHIGETGGFVEIRSNINQFGLKKNDIIYVKEYKIIYKYNK